MVLTTGEPLYALNQSAWPMRTYTIGSEEEKMITFFFFLYGSFEASQLQFLSQLSNYLFKLILNTFIEHVCLFIFLSSRCCCCWWCVIPSTGPQNIEYFIYLFVVA